MLERNVFCYHYGKGIALADLFRWRDTQSLPGELLPKLADLLANGTAGRLHRIVATERRLRRLRKLNAGTEQRHQQGGREDLAEMVIGQILKARLAGLVGAGHGTEIQRLIARRREDDALPGHHNAVLPI